ncbi:MAG: hypothetical protein R6U21_06000 [Thermoplasmatota archaeon]
MVKTYGFLAVTVVFDFIEKTMVAEINLAWIINLMVSFEKTRKHIFIIRK